MLKSENMRVYCNSDLDQGLRNAGSKAKHGVQKGPYLKFRDSILCSLTSAFCHLISVI